MDGLQRREASLRWSPSVGGGQGESGGLALSSSRTSALRTHPSGRSVGVNVGLPQPGPARTGHEARSVGGRKLPVGNCTPSFPIRTSSTARRKAVTKSE